jgi:Pilus assembly protein, PilP
MSGRCVAGWMGLAIVLLGVGRGHAQPPRAVTAVDPAITGRPEGRLDPRGALGATRHDRRDPFRPPRLGAGSAAAVGEARTPLERYELGQLRLVAVIYGNTQARAVLEVKRGTRIGPNGGEVAAIDKGRMVVRETYTDFYGEQRPSETVLEMKTREQKPGKSDDGRGRP